MRPARWIRRSLTVLMPRASSRHVGCRSGGRPFTCCVSNGRSERSRSMAKMPTHCAGQMEATQSKAPLRRWRLRRKQYSSGCAKVVYRDTSWRKVSLGKSFCQPTGSMSYANKYGAPDDLNRRHHEVLGSPKTLAHSPRFCQGSRQRCWNEQYVDKSNGRTVTISHT